MNLKNENLSLRYLYLLKSREEIVTDSIGNILDLIRSDDLANLVSEIRNSTSSKSRKELKLKLPAFYPNLLFLENDTPDTIRPSGIIGYDIDLKDQEEGFDVAKLKESIITIPSCLYAYISPSGGLKFGIKTDFTDCEDENSTKERFKIAYRLTLRYLIDNIRIEFVCDKAASSIMLTSFFSHDPDAYINLNCEDHLINDECVYEVNDKWIPTESKQDSGYIQELLSYIPRLSYAERLPINYAVLNCLGADGVSVLIDHWGSRGISIPKIKAQIESQSKKINFGSIGHLVNVAQRYGYTKAPTGRARNKLLPYKSEVQLKPLLSAEMGITKLHEIVKEFFTQNNNVFVNVSAGAGKSTEVLKILAKEIPYNKKILYLVPTHNLAQELEEKFKIARNRPDINKFEEKHRLHSIQDKEFNSMLVRLKTFKEPISGIVHLYGKDKLCDSEFAKKAFDGASNIPLKFCSTCHNPTGCRYIEQFQNRFDNIRIMTHSEWSGSQSGWFGGYEEKFGGYKKIKGEYVEEEGDLYPSGNKWVPDYIIIDENIISVNLLNTQCDDGRKHKSIRNIIDSVTKGYSLSEAIEGNLEEIILDDFENSKPRFPIFKKNIEEYTKLISTRNEELKSYSIILEHLISYLKTKDQKYLQGMWVADNQLHFAPVSQASNHYQHIPTLFLDATANAEVVQAALGNIKFHSISIESKSDIQLYQLANFTVTKEYVNIADNRIELVQWIKAIINKGQYNKVGLITYFKAKDIDGFFDKFLAEEVGADVYSHFGAVRGLDAFDEVDCLLIVGRHFVGTDSVSKLSAAIFGELEEYESAYVDRPIRMMDRSKYLLNCSIPVNGKHIAINEHFSLSETKQAIGRARAIHGKKKDVYLFSNESLGLDVAVTDFFYRPTKDTVTCSDEVIQKIKSIGYVSNNPKALADVGLNESDIRSRRPRIIEILEENDIHLVECNMVDSTYRRSVVKYFVADRSKFIVDQEFDKKKFVSFVEKENEIR